MAPTSVIRAKESNGVSNDGKSKPRKNSVSEAENDSLLKMKRRKKKLPHEIENPEGEISPCKPAAFLGFFKPDLAKKAGEGPNPEGEIKMTNPAAFLDFLKPPVWTRKCPAPRDEVYTPLPPPDPEKFPRLKKKKKWKRTPRGILVKRGWYCERSGLPISRGRDENFLNYSPEELKVVRRIAERKRQKSDDKYSKMYKSYIKGLESNKGHIMRLMSDLVTLADEKHHTKQTLLYERWHTQVFEHIQRQIEDALNEMSPDYIKDKLRWFHYQYMAIANKQMVLQDRPRPDYDPFESLKHTIKFSVKDLCDPVKHDLTKENAEKRFMGESVPSKAMTKETLPLMDWPENHFRASKWGHIEADEEDGSEIVISQPEYHPQPSFLSATSRTSEIILCCDFCSSLYSHDLLYNQVFVGEEYVRAELPRGKYIVPNKGMLPENHVDKPQGKAIIWDAEVHKLPKLRLWYN